MIINSGMRTDIPAYFSEWFYNRIAEGYVLTRNPYYPEQVTRYQLNPDVVDVLCFCTKNPAPMLKRLDEIKDYRQFWFVTITPYGKEIEPYVPNKEDVMNSFIQLSGQVGSHAMSWRYDPIFIMEPYSVEYHIQSFEKMAAKLEGYTEQCVISFIDLYSKTRSNFPKVRAVTREEQDAIGEAFARIGSKHGIQIRSCCEGEELARFGVNTEGCMTKRVIENAIGTTVEIPKREKSPREECNCLMGHDIGMYNTCGHGCIYCYANYNRELVEQNMRLHDKNSPLLIGHVREDDIVRDSKQESYISGQLSFFL